MQLKRTKVLNRTNKQRRATMFMLAKSLMYPLIQPSYNAKPKEL
uniref:Uncharacterized protein n=1 Tax=Anguilla anguilla TaxID=7936 RepID=A0A0E9W796_ANGAN